MSNRRKRRRRQRRPSDIKKHAPTAAILIALSLATFSVFHFIMPQISAVEAVDKKIADCRSNKAVGHHTIVLIDVTDRLSDSQKQNVSFMVRDTQKSIPIGGKISVYLLNEEVFAPIELISECRPKSADDINPIAESALGQTVAWNGFTLSVNLALDKALSTDESSFSPIIEAIQIVSDRYDFSPRVNTRKIIVISDMLQHSETVSLYDLSYLNEIKDGVNVGNPIGLDLSGVQIISNAVRRPEVGQQQHSGTKIFWINLFEEANVESYSCGDFSEVCLK